MKILILHGIQGHAGKHWMGWLADGLIKIGHEVIMPTLPNADQPDREQWLQSVKELLKEVDPEELVIITHSLGAATAMDYIEVLNKPIRALIAVAGFYYAYGAELNDYFMKVKKLDMHKVKANIQNSYVIYGDNDPYVPQKALLDLALALDADTEVIENGGHINTEAGFTKLPLVLDILAEQE